MSCKQQYNDQTQPPSFKIIWVVLTYEFFSEWQNPVKCLINVLYIYAVYTSL